MARRSALAAAMAMCGIMLATEAPAQDGDSARLRSIVACGTIAKKSARLSCYDALVLATPVKTGKAAVPRGFEPAGAPAVAVAVAAAPAPPPSFGSETLKRNKAERAKDVNQMIARTVSVIDDGIGHYTITLEGGARWKMTELLPNFIPPRPGDVVRLRKASLGSYLLDVNYQPSVRVQRIQ